MSDVSYLAHTDHLNTPRVITDQQQRVVWRWDHTDPFGANPPDEDPDGDGNRFEFNLRFPGQYYDKETNLHYNGWRDYDAGIGAFIQPEPLGLAGDINLYRYARSNPLSVIDPDGRQSKTPNQNPAAACSYYESVCNRTNGQCFYYCVTGPNICRYPYASPFLWGVSQEKVNCIRTCLIREDQQAWGNPQNLTKGCPSCVKDSVIDAYHDKCYTSCGVSTSRYPGVRPGGIPLGNE